MQVARPVKFDVESVQRAGWSLRERDLFAHLIGVPPSDVASQESAMRTQAIGAGFEGLEERLLLAGNITSALAAGVLVLDGDALANQVQLTVASNGQLTATGLSGTTINGVASVNFGVVNTLTVHGAAGDDNISLNATAALIANDVTIDGGADNDTISVTGRFGANLDLIGGTGLGSDTITVSKATVAVDLDLDAGAGNNKVTVSGATVSQEAVIQSGTGNDSVKIDGTAFFRDLTLTDTGGNNSLNITNSSTRNDVLVALGAGNDTVLVNGLTAGARVGATANGLISIDFGDGKNVLSMSKSKALGTGLTDGILLTGGTGSDLFGIVDSQSASSILIDTGDGANRVELSRVQIAGAQGVLFGPGDLDILTGLGADSVKLDRVNVVGVGIVDMGLENDILQVINSRFSALDVDMGAGDDTAYLSDNSYSRLIGSFIIGGAGVDNLTIFANQPTFNFVNNVPNALFETTRIGKVI